MWFMLSVLRFLLICCFMLTAFLCATSVWYYLDVLMCVSVYINFYFLSFSSFSFILFSWYFLWILWSDANKDDDDD